MCCDKAETEKCYTRQIPVTGYHQHNTHLHLEATPVVVSCFEGFSVSANERLVREDETTNGDRCRQILQQNLPHIAKYLGFERWCVFQDDGNRTRRTKLNVERVQDKIMKVLEWPGQGNALKLMLKCVKWLEDNCSGAPHQTRRRLRKICKEGTKGKYPKSRCAKLIQTYLRKSNALIAAWGACTRDSLWRLCTNFTLQIPVFHFQSL